MNKFYITTAIPYVNAKPHIGHALEFVQSDVVARYHRLIGDQTTFLSGGDENALKNVQAAEKEGKNPQDFVDQNSALFEDLAEKLNIAFDVFQKGSSEQHHKSSQQLWNLCFENGDIYKKEYKGLYCVGCELFYERDELDENGECYEHPGKKLDEVSETNYFFRLSKYESAILELLENNTIKIVPEARKNEAIAFVKQGLKDISISRSNERAKNWGVPVPNDPSQRIYVWFDALNIYQSGVGFGWDEEKYKKIWPADVHVIGKGIIRFHAVYWPAFLLSAKLPLPKSIFAHGYLTVNGQKMSKTIGNVIDPESFVDKYGADSLRYYLLSQFSPSEDGDFSEEKFEEVYNADLANGLGNLVARVAKLCERVEIDPPKRTDFPSDYKADIENFKFNEVLESIWKQIRLVDQEIEKEQPWKISDKSKLQPLLQKWANTIVKIATELEPFTPETTEKIFDLFSTGKVEATKPLFPRL